MLPNNNLSQEQAKWLVEFYGTKYSQGGRIDVTTIQYHQKAFNYIKGADSPIPSCNCHWISAAKVAQSLYSQYEADIKAVAYPPKKRGRKK
jgi:hypothetical protein